MKKFYKSIYVFLLIFLCLFSEINPSLAENAKTVHIGLLADCPPVAFYTGVYPEQKLRGLAVDLSEFINYQFNIKPVFHVGGLEQLKSWLKDGTIDYVCGIPQISASYFSDFSILETNFFFTRKILVKNQDVHITCERDFKRRTIAFLERDKYHENLNIYKMEKKLVSSYREGLLELSLGEVDAFVPPCSEIAAYISQQEEDSPVIEKGGSLENIPLVFVFHNNDPAKENIGQILNLSFSQQSLNEIKDKWLGRVIYHEKSFLEKYQSVIIYTILILFALIIIALGWTVTMRRKVAQVTKRLQATEQRFKSLFDASPDMMLILDNKGTILLINTIVQGKLGSKKKNSSRLIGKSIFEFIPHNHINDMKELLTKSYAGENVYREIPFIYTDSANTLQKIDLEISMFCTEGIEREEKIICCIARDITERLKLEKELINTERLGIIGKMAAGIAHEVNNPLNIILTNTELLQELTDNEEELPYLQAISGNVERAAKIIQQLLNLSSPKAPNKTRINLSEIIQICFSFIKPRLKQVHINTDNLPDELPVMGDASQLEQVFLNIFLNALSGMNDKGTLTISAQIDIVTHDTVKIVVQDTGIGISKENLKKIFDIFYTTKNKEGFGLGLFICRNIVENHGGVLYAESEEGNGASFILEFPLA